MPDRDESLPFDLVASCLERMETEGESALESLCREHPAEADRLRARISQLAKFGFALPRRGEEVPERLGQFKILARLGGGGMGVVYAAEQDGLGRRVALKLVRPGTLYFPGARERFRREVEALARLQHPGIVPVHAGGEENGVPYLAMELVRGATLEEALEELAPRAAASDITKLHGRDLLSAVSAIVARRESAEPRAADPRGTPASRTPNPSGPPLAPAVYSGSWIVTCARIARHVADALQHAHDHGVLHRDVKPSNVMLTPEGRVLLLDFGLAAAEGSTRLTGSGQPLGSPAYMSPETLRGEHPAVDARADVYSLGVTLYEALTFHQPFATKSFEQTARLVLAANPPSPRARNPAVPRDLETVVLAAMERERERRHASAQLLARDLENVLELRPIAVRPPTLSRRILRWTQRRPALATAYALSAVLLIVGPLAYELQRQRTIATILAARDQAERAFETALEAVGHVLRDIAVEDLEDVPRMQRARLVAIDHALELFPRIEQDRADDPLVRSSRSDLHRSRGDILRDLGRTEEAAKEYERELALRRELLAGDLESGDPNVQQARVKLASAIDRLAKATFALGRAADAIPQYLEGIALLKEACAARPGELGWGSDLVVSLANLAEARRDVKDLEGARAALEEALPMAAAAREAAPGDAGVLWTEARVFADFSSLDDLDGRAEEALTWARLAFESYSAAHLADPSRRSLAFDVSTGHKVMGVCLNELRRFGEAIVEAEKGLAIVDGLLVDFPDAVRYRDQRSRLLQGIGISYARSGRLDDAQRILTTRMEELERLCELAPERRDIALESVQALSNAATSLIDANADPAGSDRPDRFGELDRALELVERAATRLEFARDGSASVAAETSAVYVPYNRARALCFADRAPAAREAIESFEKDARADDAFRLRYAADLWNEFVFCLRRVRAEGDPAALQDAADPDAAEADAAEADAEARMFALLGRAIDAGYRDRRELETTPSLEEFRDTPEFQALIARVP